MRRPENNGLLHRNGAVSMNCKPGDLAIIVFAPVTTRLLGHIVEVIGIFPRETMKSRWKQGITWEIRYPDGRLIEQVWSATGTQYGLTRAFNDRGLRPIRPGDLCETSVVGKEVTA